MARKHFFLLKISRIVSSKKFLSLIPLLCAAVVISNSIPAVTFAANRSSGGSATSAASTSSSSSHSRGGPFGLGIAIGDPSAITGKYWLSSSDALDFGISFNLDRYVLFYGDYLLHAWRLPGRAHELSPYIGIGGVIAFSSGSDHYWIDDKYFPHRSSSSAAFGIRIPLGIEWRPSAAPIGVFLEIAPGLTIIPGTNSFFQGAIGIRWYF
jgi:hypothetical protein